MWCKGTCMQCLMWQLEEKARKKGHWGLGNSYRKGVTQADIARRLRVSRAAVCQWLKRARKKGQRALQSKPRPGRPPSS